MPGDLPNNEVPPAQLIRGPMTGLSEIRSSQIGIDIYWKNVRLSGITSFTSGTPLFVGITFSPPLEGWNAGRFLGIHKERERILQRFGE